MARLVSSGQSECIEGLRAALPEDDAGVATSGEWRHHHVAVVDEYPMTVTGKVRKVELRERAKQLLS